MPRPRKAVEHKARTGRSPGHDAGGRPVRSVVPLPPLDEPPPPPESLGASGRTRWERATMQAKAWMCDLDHGALLRYCELFDWRDAMIAQITADGLTTRGSTKQVRSHPLIREIHAINAEIRALEGQLGLTPAARAQLGCQVKPAGLDAMIARRRGQPA